MSDIRKLIDILNETTVAGAVATGPAAPLGGVHKRVEEEQTNETAMPEVIEYGNWENSALVTEKKTKSMRPKSKRIVKSVYGVDNTSAEGGEANEGKKPEAEPKKKVRESARSVAEDQVNEEDLIVNPAAIKKAMGIIAKDKVRQDHEVEMARSDLFQAAQNAQKIHAMIKDRSEDDGLEGWVQEKIVKAADYLNTVREYMEGQHVEQGVAEGSLNEGQYEMMMRNGQVKKFIAKDDADAKRIAAGHGAKSVIRLKGGVPAGKIAEQGVAEGKCPECGGPAFEDEQLAEAKDACYHKVKSRYKVWPSAYASGALSKCRKVGASNWGNKSK